MGRQPREKSESGFYHVVARGNGKQILFESDEDRMRFLEIMRAAFDRLEMSITAWCLMDNHVHLLVADPKDTLSEGMRRLLGTYATYYNSKQTHCGHVFQERFYSLPITDEAQLAAAINYVHMNPERAGLARAEQYPWSSLFEYLNGSLPGYSYAIVDGAVVADMGWVDTLLMMVEESRKADIPGYLLPPYRNDATEELIATAQLALGSCDPRSLKMFDKKKRDDGIASLAAAGFTLRQIERLTGIGKSTIARIVKKRNTGAKNGTVSPGTSVPF